MLKNFWYVAEDSKNVGTKPVHVRMLCQNLVLFRDETGKVACLSDICIHRGASLSGGKVVDGCVQCPYHGWRFGSDGVVTKIPAQKNRKIPKRARVDSYPTQERYGWIWVFLGDLPEAERPPIPEFPEYDDPEWRVVKGEWSWDADYARVVENGLDFAHAPFVHEGAFGDPDEAEIEDFEIEYHEWGAYAQATMKPPKPKGLWSFLVKERSPVVARTGFHLSGALMRLHVTISPKMNLVIYDVNTPVDETTTLTRWAAARDFFTGSWADFDARRRTLKIFRQDAEILHRVNPRLLPVDLSEELSVKSDGLQIAYRKLRRKYVEKGWAIDTEKLVELGHKHARTIPSPARASADAPSRWVLPSVPLKPERVRKR